MQQHTYGHMVNNHIYKAILCHKYMVLRILKFVSAGISEMETYQPDQDALDVHGHQVVVVNEFVYLGALTHSSVHSSYNIHRCTGFTRSAMQNSDNCIWKSRLAPSTKLQLYNTCILPIMLYGPECWALSKPDASKIEAPDQWCLRRIHNIYWCQLVSNCEVRRTTEHPPLISIIQKRRLMLFGHLASMDESADASRILIAVLQSDWKRPALTPPGWSLWKRVKRPIISQPQCATCHRAGTGQSTL